MQIYVDRNAVRSGNGQKEYPFQTISEAAKIARSGDEVLVAPGVYREYVDPANAGCADARIVYRSVEPGKAVITGAEIVDNWEHLEDICKKLSEKEDVWYATNIEIYDYVNAYYSLIHSADGNVIFNPTIYDIWIEIDRKTYCVKSAETLIISKS